MDTVTSLAKLTNPLGGQQIELQQVEYAAGGMPLLRVRIRERTRFTIFEVDPATAEDWGQAMLDWARSQPRG